jgi:pyrroloquinoline quinone biosynthesis protein B
MINNRACIRFQIFITTLISLWTFTAPAETGSANNESSPYLFVLGVAQDGGYPQTGCYRPHCMRAWNDPTLKRLTSSIAVVDGKHGAKYLFDATPDMALAGVFLTHGHMGHYTGLMHFGHEAIGADAIRVFAMPRMHDYLTDNGPWSQLVSFRNIELVRIEDGKEIILNDELLVVPLQVPHRDEYTETVGYRINGPNKSALFIPDIDKWTKWDIDIRELVREVDYALLDASFFADGELPNRDMSQIGHPFVQESMELFADLAEEDKAKIIFIHFNHTNPLLIDGSDAQKTVRALGFRFATEGMRLPL